MAHVALMTCCVGLVDARALSEGCESGLIHSFVDVEPTDHTFQVAGGLGEVVLPGDGLFRLALQKLLDVLCSGLLPGQWSSLSSCGRACLDQHLWAIFIQP